MKHITSRLLSKTSAMSCYSWSLPAGPLCGGFKLGPGSICGQCYAAQGRYRFTNVARAQQARLTWWQTTPLKERVAVLSYLINTELNGYFRVFDSGDFYCTQDVEDWIAITKACPKTRFWFPTRCWHRKEYRRSLHKLSLQPNVVVRASALFLNKSLTRKEKALCNLRHTSTVVTHGKGCPKQTHGSCGKARCRRCWDKRVLDIEYKAHGHKVNWRKKTYEQNRITGNQ